MKIVGDKLPNRKFRKGQRVRCIAFRDFKGVVVGHKLDYQPDLIWLATIRITCIPNDNKKWETTIGSIVDLYEDQWEKQ